MATIGLDSLWYAPITEDADSNETYGTPKKLAKAISASMTVNVAEAILYADDGASEVAKEFTNGTLTLGIDDIGTQVAADLLGAKLSSAGGIVSSAEDTAPNVAVGFRAKKSNGKYRYFWIYRVKFGVPNTELATKGESITFNTPSIEGKITRRNKADSNGNHPWKYEITEGDTGVKPAIITGWFGSVQEPTYGA